MRWLWCEAFALAWLMAACFGGLWLVTLRSLSRAEQERDDLWDELHDRG